jgi:hypothetical protein
MLQGAGAFDHHIEHRRARRRSIRSATVLPASPTSIASPRILHSNGG